MEIDGQKSQKTISEKSQKPQWFQIILVFFIVIYLLCRIIVPIFVKDFKMPEFSWQDISLIIIVILYASGILERLKEFSVNKDGISFKVEEKIKTLEVRQKQQERIISGLKDNFVNSMQLINEGLQDSSVIDSDKLAGIFNKAVEVIMKPDKSKRD
ncbi:MAG: hypothetical protein LWY06_01510 [Firmicutes bacterium]|nr:hypothetical protein [Bacillota bacterium]